MPNGVRTLRFVILILASFYASDCAAAALKVKFNACSRSSFPVLLTIELEHGEIQTIRFTEVGAADRTSAKDINLPDPSPGRFFFNATLEANWGAVDTRVSIRLNVADLLEGSGVIPLYFDDEQINYSDALVQKIYRDRGNTPCTLAIAQYKLGKLCDMALDISALAELYKWNCVKALFDINYQLSEQTLGVIRIQENIKELLLQFRNRKVPVQTNTSVVSVTPETYATGYATKVARMDWARGRQIENLRKERQIPAAAALLDYFSNRLRYARQHDGAPIDDLPLGYTDDPALVEAEFGVNQAWLDGQQYIKRQVASNPSEP